MTQKYTSNTPLLMGSWKSILLPRSSGFFFVCVCVFVFFLFSSMSFYSLCNGLAFFNTGKWLGLYPLSTLSRLRSGLVSRLAPREFARELDWEAGRRRLRISEKEGTENKSNSNSIPEKIQAVRITKRSLPTTINWLTLRLTENLAPLLRRTFFPRLEAGALWF